jgi:hypothetical protein
LARQKNYRVFFGYLIP